MKVPAVALLQNRSGNGPPQSDTAQRDVGGIGILRSANRTRRQRVGSHMKAIRPDTPLPLSPCGASMDLRATLAIQIDRLAWLYLRVHPWAS